MEPRKEINIKDTLALGELPHKVMIKDKYGGYFIQPFINKEKQLLTIEKCTSISCSKKFTAVFL
jgi:hypothetical protein